MKVYLKLHNEDADMVEVFTEIQVDKKYLACVIHIDCITDPIIKEFLSYGDDCVICNLTSERRD